MFTQAPPPENENPEALGGGNGALRTDRLASAIKRKLYLTAQVLLTEIPTIAAAAGVTKYCGTAAFTGLETLSFWIEEVRHKLRRGELLRDLGQLDEADQEALEADVANLMQVMIAVIAEQRRTA